MICPKCGFEQEERLDCKECGIVFSKYNARLQSSETSEPVANDDASFKVELQELKIQMRELSTRAIDVEFEKAERKKLRSDLKALEDQVQSWQAEAESRMQRLEDALESIRREFNAAPETQINPAVPEEIKKETAQLAEKLNGIIGQFTTLWEKTGQNSFQMTELRDQMASLRNEVLELKNQLAGLKTAQVDEEPKTILEDDIKAIRKNLDELGQFLSGLARNGEQIS